MDDRSELRLNRHGREREVVMRSNYQRRIARTWHFALSCARVAQARLASVPPLVRQVSAAAAVLALVSAPRDSVLGSLADGASRVFGPIVYWVVPWFLVRSIFRSRVHDTQLFLVLVVWSILSESFTGASVSVVGASAGAVLKHLFGPAAFAGAAALVCALVYYLKVPDGAPSAPKPSIDDAGKFTAVEQEVIEALLAQGFRNRRLVQDAVRRTRSSTSTEHSFEALFRVAITHLRH